MHSKCADMHYAQYAPSRYLQQGDTLERYEKNKRT
jgi:hypothetical protein